MQELMTIDADSATVRDCILAIQRGGANMALAVDASGVLVGIVTDGDLRRAWLEGYELNSPISPFIQRAPLTVTPGESRTAILDLMQARGIAQVPVVDDMGRLRGVHLIREFLAHSPRPNVALVLAGGRGTRLGPLTSHLPKPMIAVAGRPILERIVTHLVGYGITEIVLAVGYRAEVIEEHFADGAKFGCMITYLRESPDKPLGTGGPLASLLRARPDLDEPVIAMNGDLVTQFDVGGLLEHHSATESDVTIGSFTYAHEIPFGILETQCGGRVSKVAEKPLRLETVSAGIYAISPSLLRSVPHDVYFPITAFLADALERGMRVSAWDCGQDWIDVGRPHDLARARGET